MRNLIPLHFDTDPTEPTKDGGFFGVRGEWSSSATNAGVLLFLTAPVLIDGVFLWIWTDWVSSVILLKAQQEHCCYY